MMRWWRRDKRSTSSSAPVPRPMQELAAQILKDNPTLPDEIQGAIHNLTRSNPLPDQVALGQLAINAVGAIASRQHINAIFADLPTSLREWYWTPTWEASRTWLESHLNALPYDAVQLLGIAATRARSMDDDAGAQVIETHVELLSRAQRSSVEEAYQNILNRKNQSAPPKDEKILRMAQVAHDALTWLNTIPWNASHAYLEEHPHLLTDVADMILAIVMHGTDGTVNPGVLQRRRLLEKARQVGIDEAYRSITDNLALHEQRREEAKLWTELQQIVAAGGRFEELDVVCRRLLALDASNGLLNSTMRHIVHLTLAVALRGQARESERSKAASLLREAIQHFDAASAELADELDKLLETQKLKASTLARLADITYGQDRIVTLTAVVECLTGLIGRRDSISDEELADALEGRGDVFAKLAEALYGTSVVEDAEAAIADYDAALKLIHRDQDPDRWAWLCSKKGDTLDNIAEMQVPAQRARTLQAAIESYDLALEGRSSDTDPSQWASMRSNKGKAILDLANTLRGDERFYLLRDALECLLEALAEFDKYPHDNNWFITNNWLGLTLWAMSNYHRGPVRAYGLRQAVAAYDEAIGVGRETNPYFWASLQTHKGAALWDLAKDLGNDEAVTTLTKAIEAYSLALVVPGFEESVANWATTQNNMGTTLWELSRFQSGAQRVNTLKEVVACYERSLEVLSPELAPVTYRQYARALVTATLTLVSAHGKNSEDDLIATLLDRAWEVVVSAMSISDRLMERTPIGGFRIDERRESVSLFNSAAFILALQGHLDEAISYLEDGRARGLVEIMNRRGIDLDRLSSEERARYLSALRAVEEIEALGRQVRQADMIKLVEEAERRERNLAEVLNSLHPALQRLAAEERITRADLRAGLIEGDAFVYFAAHQYGSLIIIAPKDGHALSEVLPDLTSDYLEGLCVQQDEEGSDRRGYFPAALGIGKQPLDEALDELLPILGDKLMRSVVLLARRARVQRLVVVPGHMFSVLPLHAASYTPIAPSDPPTMPTGRRYACDDIAISYALSGRTYLAAQARALMLSRNGPPLRGFVVENPQLTRSNEAWTPGMNGFLAYAKEEAYAVEESMRQAGFVQIDVVREKNATWRRVVDGIQEADVVHLAMHAHFDQKNPMYSALSVAPNAALFVRDLLDGRIMHIDRLRLAVLSCCQSSVGDPQLINDEATGLFGALLAAGACAVVGSLWRVPDASTAKLMEKFSHRYLRTGLPPAEALRNAQRDLRQILSEQSAIHFQTAHTDAGVLEFSYKAEGAVPHSAHPQASQNISPKSVPERYLTTYWAMSRAQLTAAERNTGVGEPSISKANRTALGHPVHWAAFVHYGALMPIVQPPNKVEVTAFSSAELVQGAAVLNTPQVPTDGQTSEAIDLHNAMNRASRETPTMEGRCPRCNAADAIPVWGQGEPRLLECISCHLRYLPEASSSGTGTQ